MGLEEQRELAPALAYEVAEKVETLDLGVHTGFSTMTRNDESGLLDQNQTVEDQVDELRLGRFDCLVAVDDRRICCDEYFFDPVRSEEG